MLRVFRLLYSGAPHEISSFQESAARERRNRNKNNTSTVNADHQCLGCGGVPRLAVVAAALTQLRNLGVVGPAVNLQDLEPRFRINDEIPLRRRSQGARDRARYLDGAACMGAVIRGREECLCVGLLRVLVEHALEDVGLRVADEPLEAAARRRRAYMHLCVFRDDGSRRRDVKDWEWWKRHAQEKLKR
eukprot:6176816-Pleurochrysis_carterae.AAC.1